MMVRCLYKEILKDRWYGRAQKSYYRLCSKEYYVAAIFSKGLESQWSEELRRLLGMQELWIVSEDQFTIQQDITREF